MKRYGYLVLLVILVILTSCIKKQPPDEFEAYGPTKETQTVAQKIQEGVKVIKEEDLLKDLELKSIDMEKLYFQVRDIELFNPKWLKDSLPIYLNLENEIILDSQMTKEKFDENAKWTKNKVEAFLSDIDFCEMDDYQKSFSIIELITSKVDYDYQASELILKQNSENEFSEEEYSIIEESQSLVGAFEKNKSVCAGFSKLYHALSTHVELTSVVESGMVEHVDHLWNLVQLEGSWVGVDVTFINNDEMTVDYKWLHMPLKDFYQFRTSSIDFPEHYQTDKQYYNIDYTWYTRNGEVVTFDDFKEIVHELKNSGVKSFSFALYDLNPQQEQEVVLFVYECDDSFGFAHQILSYQGQ